MSLSNPATLDDLRRSVVASVRKIGAGFRHPADDWTSVLFVQSPEGIEVVGLDNELFARGVTKDALAVVLRGYVAERGAYRYALLLNAHIAVEPSEEQLEAVRREELRIEQIEGARELLFLCVGDAEEEQVWRAEIFRDRRYVRKLGPWEHLDEASGWSFEGRFAGLNETLRRPR